MFNFFKKTDKVKKFWKWFEKNKDHFTDLEFEGEKKLNKILKKLQKIEEGLSLEISNEVNGVREIVISAEGDIDKFPIVKEIVKNAPIIKGWKTVAFRQPAREDFVLHYGDLQLSPSQLYFYPIVEEDALDIIIFGEGFQDKDPDILAHYGLIMLDNVLGEFNCVIKVRHYDFLDIEDAEDQNMLRPLTELSTFLENFYMNKN